MSTLQPALRSGVKQTGGQAGARARERGARAEILPSIGNRQRAIMIPLTLRDPQEAEEAEHVIERSPLLGSHKHDTVQIFLSSATHSLCSSQ